jgi:hypothetical protein
MASLTITVSIPATPASATRAQELQWAQRGVEIAIQQARSAGGVQTSGTVAADGQSALATWTYTPTASS